MADLILIGGGGHALVVAEAAAAAGWTICGFLDDAPAPVLAVGVPSASVLGKLDGLERVLSDRPGASVLIAIGHAATRRAVIGRLDACGMGERAATVIHASAVVSPTARIDRGVFIGPRAVVHTRAVVAAHAIINTGAIVEHECEIGESAHIAPGSILGGRARVGADALVGIGARVMLSRTIGAGAVVGCGAVVVSDVAPGAVVMGVPARERA